MNIKLYSKIIKNINTKAPFEIGIQTLVYMFLQDFFEDSKAVLVVVDKARKTSRYVSDTGISDLAVVSDDFDFYDDEKGQVIISIEVKLKGLENNYEQVIGHLLTFGKVLYTDAKEWVYYDFEKACKANNIDESEYEEFMNKLKEVIGLKREIAKKKASIVGLLGQKTRREKNHQETIKQEKAIEECNKKIADKTKDLDKLENEIKNWLDGKKWIREYIKNGEWGKVIKLFKDTQQAFEINKQQYQELKGRIAAIVQSLL